MKKPDAQHTTNAKGIHSRGARHGGGPALDSILRNAYRRHARGRIARAAMTACLGR